MHKIIIVDDNKVIANTLKIRINYLFPEIEVCGVFNNASDTLNFMDKGTDYIVITDISMPEMDGLQMTEKIKTDGYNAQIIIITGYEKLEYFKWAIENQVIAFILKPIEDEALKNAVSTSIERLKMQNNLSELNNTIETMKVKEEFEKRFTELSNALGADTFDVCDYTVNKNLSLYDSNKSNITLYCINPCSALQIVEIEQNLLFKIIRDNPKYKMFEKHLFISKNIVVVTDTANEAINSKLKECISAFFDENKMSYKVVSTKVSGSIFQGVAKLVCMLYNECYQGDFTFSDVKKLGDEVNLLLSRIKLLLSLNMFEEAINLFVNAIKSYAIVASVFSLNDTYKKFIIVLINAQRDAAFELKYTQELLFPLLAFKDWADLHERLLMIAAKCQKTHKNVGETVVRFINENFTTHISLNTLAKKVYMHPNYLGQLIKEQTGCSFNDYLNSLRVEHAKEILSSNHNIKLNELSANLGFSDNKYFSKVFKKVTGVSPSNYIK